MATFLVETYAPRGSDLGVLCDEARAAASGAGRPAATGVRYVQTVYIAEDETCFHVFDAASAAAVAQASRGTPLQAGRVVAAMLASGLPFTATASQERQ